MQHGRGGATGGCSLRQVEPGHLVAIVDDLDAGEGVTITATRASRSPPTPALPAPPTVGAPGPRARAGRSRRSPR